MAQRNKLASMSVEALLKLRDDVENVLTRKAEQLRTQLSRLSVESASRGKVVGRSALKGRKVGIKYRDNAGNAWAGRGAQPVWLRERLKAGARLEDFAIGGQATARKKKRVAAVEPRSEVSLH
jgi:DNA-binding protein H-NS